MFWNLVHNENTKNLQRKMLWIELALLAALILIMLVSLFAVFKLNVGGEFSAPEMQDSMRASLTWPQALAENLGLAGGSGLGGLLIVILVGTATAQEYQWRTMHLWLSRGVSRPALLLSKLVSLLLPSLLFVLAALLVLSITSAIFSLNLTGGLAWNQVNYGQLILSVLRTTYTLLPYAGLTFLLAIATRSVTAAIGVGLAYTLLFEGILMQLLGMAGGIFARLGAYLPGGLGRQLIEMNVTIANQPVPAELQPGAAILGIALWTILFTGLAVLAFQKQDLSE